MRAPTALAARMWQDRPQARRRYRCTRGQAAQPEPGPHARQRPVELGKHVGKIFVRQLELALRHVQPERGFAQQPRDIDAIPGPGTGALQCLPVRHETHDLDADSKRARVVSPPTSATSYPRARSNIPAQKPQASSDRPAAGSGSTCTRRCCAHGRKVAQVRCQRLVANGNGVGSFGKVHPGNQHVGGHHQLLAGGHIEDSGIITMRARHPGEQPAGARSSD